jgi:hypothetical protein
VGLSKRQHCMMHCCKVLQNATAHRGAPMTCTQPARNGKLQVNHAPRSQLQLLP